MNQYRPSSFKLLPDVIKNLLIINGLFFLATYAAPAIGINLTKELGLYNILSSDFRPYQLVTHMFMHGGVWHIFFNMFALWMFGSPLENLWGPKRFLIFYVVTGLGAALLHMGVGAYEIQSLVSSLKEAGLSADYLQMIKNGSGLDVQSLMSNYPRDIADNIGLLYRKYHMPTVGASGAVFGVLLGFGMLFPNTLIYIYFLFPIKAKYFVVLYGILELYNGIANNPADNIAHFAHLGGMLFGFILIKYWRKDRRNFY